MQSEKCKVKNEESERRVILHFAIVNSHFALPTRSIASEAEVPVPIEKEKRKKARATVGGSSLFETLRSWRVRPRRRYSPRPGLTYW